MFIVVDFFFIVVFIGRVWAWENNWLCIFATPIVIPHPTLTLAPIPNLCIFATPIVIPRLLCLLVEFGCGKTIGFVFLQRQLLSHAQTRPSHLFRAFVFLQRQLLSHAQTRPSHLFLSPTLPSRYARKCGMVPNGEEHGAGYSGEKQLE